jgi:hypothetical protein
MSLLERKAMTEEKKLPESQKNPWDLLDVLTSRVGKITALVGAIGGLVVGANQLISKSDTKGSTNPVALVHKAETGDSKPPVLSDCFRRDMIVEPKTVAISKWDSMMLKWTGQNDCPTTFSGNAYVTFKIKANDRVRIMPPYEECVSNDPSCWQPVSIDRGNVAGEVMSPRLYLISKPLGAPVDLGISWVVYNLEDKKQLRAGTVKITLLDDP